MLRSPKRPAFPSTPRRLPLLPATLSKKDSELAVNASLETITETLIQGEKVQLVGFGAFDVKERGVRMGRNPKTKKEIEIPASRVPQFKAGKALKEAVDKK